MPVVNSESALGLDRVPGTYSSSYGQRLSKPSPMTMMVTNEVVQEHKERVPSTAMELSSGEESSDDSSHADRKKTDGSDDEREAMSQGKTIQRLSLARLPTKDSWNSHGNTSKLVSEDDSHASSKSSTSSVYRDNSNSKHDMTTEDLPLTKGSKQELWQDEDGDHQGSVGIWQEEKKEANENLLHQVPAFFSKIRIALKAEITPMPDGDEYYFV